MLLVLGRPGAGCTSFLKIVANMRDSYTHIGGDVNYGGIDPDTFAKKYRGQVCYNEEEDQHYPTLTTKQTLEFALRTKTPGRRIPGESKADFVDRILYLLGSMRLMGVGCSCLRTSRICLCLGLGCLFMGFPNC